MPSDGELAERRFFAWKAQHPHEVEDASAVWAAAWRAGAWNAIQQNTTLGLNLTQIIQRLEDLAALYADVDAERQLEHELAQASQYWRNEP
jgi:hypothetical protein